uniref:Coiled-coil domain-containing protein 39 n=1 Tax=Panagrolaimus sp. PS1159 TaxID=55785 RepID=A0AC35GFF7_9BILA
MEAIEQCVIDLQAKNKTLQQALDEQKNVFVERHVRIAQLKAHLSSQKDQLKQTRAHIDASQKNYQDEFQKIKKASNELHEIAFEAVNRRLNAVKCISNICERKIDGVKKTMEAIEATSLTKNMAELDEINYEKACLKVKINETQKKIDAYSSTNILGRQGFSR